MEPEPAAEPPAAPSAEGAQGEDASEPPTGQLPAPEPETAPVAAEPVRATAPGDEDGAGPEAGAPSELPEPLDATRQDRSPATPAPAEQQAETVADQQAQTVADDRQGSPQEAAQPAEAERPEVAAELPDAAGQAAPEEAPASEEPAEPATPPAPGYDDAEREAVLRVMRERRDIRNGFRSDPIPHEVLLRVLEAAHTAPSVGHSQPWDFVVIRSAETRRSMHELAQRQRDAYAKSLPKGRAKQFKELKIEAILDTPVNIVVTADPTRAAATPSVGTPSRRWRRTPRPSPSRTSGSPPAPRASASAGSASSTSARWSAPWACPNTSKWWPTSAWDTSTSSPRSPS